MEYQGAPRQENNTPNFTGSAPPYPANGPERAINQPEFQNGYTAVHMGQPIFVEGWDDPPMESMPTSFVQLPPHEMMMESQHAPPMRYDFKLGSDPGMGGDRDREYYQRDERSGMYDRQPSSRRSSRYDEYRSPRRGPYPPRSSRKVSSRRRHREEWDDSPMVDDNRRRGWSSTPQREDRQRYHSLYDPPVNASEEFKPGTMQDKGESRRPSEYDDVNLSKRPPVEGDRQYSYQNDRRTNERHPVSSSEYSSDRIRPQRGESASISQSSYKSRESAHDKPPSVQDQKKTKPEDIVKVPTGPKPGQILPNPVLKDLLQQNKPKTHVFAPKITSILDKTCEKPGVVSSYNPEPVIDDDLREIVAVLGIEDAFKPPVWIERNNRLFIDRANEDLIDIYSDTMID